MAKTDIKLGDILIIEENDFHGIFFGIVVEMKQKACKVYWFADYPGYPGCRTYPLPDASVNKWRENAKARR